jgi:hypothetical protein
VRSVTTIVSIGVCVVAVLTTAGCDGSASSPNPEAPSASNQDAPTAPSPEAPAEEQPAQQWAMPNLVGATLQDAQDQIQSLTAGAVYFTDSHDLTGEDRSQIMDANWKVCTQNVGPGEQLTATSQIDLGVVKLEESCP